MDQEELKKKKLKELLGELDNKRGRHTELVSVYVPAGYNLNKVMDQVKQEQSLSQNIKSKTVRKNVIGALEKIIQHLKLYKVTPGNGVAIFSGNTSADDGAADIQLWAIEPPEPIKQRLYRCGQNFVLDPLLETFKEKEVYGLIVLDKSEAEIGTLSGKRIESLKHLDSIVPGKQRKGGWSQARYRRIREGLLHDFLKKVGEIASAQFKQLENMKGILIGGPGPIKEQFADGDFMDYDLKPKVLGVVSTSYTGETGLNELIERSEDLLEEASAMRERKILERFFGEFAKDSGLAIYGFTEVMEALEAGNMELLILSEEFEWVRAKFRCGEKVYEKFIRKSRIGDEICPDGSEAELLEEKEIEEDIMKIAENMGTEIEVISTETQRGEQLKELGGIAGILRYKD